MWMQHFIQLFHFMCSKDYTCNILNFIMGENILNFIIFNFFHVFPNIVKLSPTISHGRKNEMATNATSCSIWYYSTFNKICENGNTTECRNYSSSPNFCMDLLYFYVHTLLLYFKNNIYKKMSIRIQYR